MTNALRQEIEQMEPARYARAAKKAAELTVRLAQRNGNEVSERVRYLYNASLEELEENQRRALEEREMSNLE